MSILIRRKTWLASLFSCLIFGYAQVSLAHRTGEIYQLDDPGQNAVTGLGDCIDFLLSVSDSMKSEVHQVQAVGYSFAYSNSSWTDRPGKKIYIQNFTCDPANLSTAYGTTAIVTHELGHAHYPFTEDTGSRNAFIVSYCTNEGLAVANNIVGKNQILRGSADFISIGISGNPAAQLEAIYNSTTPTDYSAMGSLFCTSNVTSTTGENYNTYYGRLYDQRFPTYSGMLIAKSSKATADFGVSASDPADLWKLLDRMIHLVKLQPQKLIEQWPGGALGLQDSNIAYMKSIPGGSFLAGSVSIEESEIRLTNSGKIILVSLSLSDSACISTNQFQSHYPDAVIVSGPTGHSDAEKTYWQITRNAGEISFGFEERRPNCLANVVFNPNRI